MRKSSSIAKVVELLKATVAEMDNVLNEYNTLLSDSARLKEIEPALAKLQTALKATISEPTTIEPATGETPPAKEGDLCKSCKHGEDKDSDCTHDASEFCGGYDKIAEPIKRVRRIRKKPIEADNTQHEI